MAGILSSLPREDVEFMINDIGQEMIAMMQPEDVLKGMDEARQDKLLALFSPEKRLAGLSPEDLLKGINAEQRQRLFEALSKTATSEK